MRHNQWDTNFLKSVLTSCGYEGTLRGNFMKTKLLVVLYFTTMAFDSNAVCLTSSLESDTDSLFQQSYELEEITIRPFKQVKAANQLPAAITQLSATAIHNQLLSDTRDISAVIPNLFIPEYGSKYTTPIYIRGIGSKTGSPSVGLYVDGIPYFEKSNFDFDLYEIEQIEVLRGPQGTLFGRNTMGGLIHITTRSPLHHQGTNLRVQTGNYNQYEVSAAHSARLSEQFGYSISGKYEYEGGYFTNMAAGEKADNRKVGNIRTRLEWQLNPKLRFSLTSLFDRSLQGANAYATFKKETGKLNEIAFNGPSYYHRTLSSTGVSLNYEGSSIQLSYQHSFQYSKDKLRQDQDFTTANRVNSLVNQKQFMTSGELNAKVQLNKLYRGLTGLFGFYQHIDKDVATYYSRFSSYKTDGLPTTGIAIYHQSVIDNVGISGLSLTFGVRYDHEHATRHFNAWKENQPSSDSMTTQATSDSSSSQQTTSDFNQLIPKIAVQYTLPVGLLYASVAKGYKTGGFNTSFNTEDQKDYGPESNWNYELGTKLTTFNKKLHAEIALFWINWKNQQIQQKVDAGGFMIRNAGRSESKGAEVTVQYNPFNGLVMNLNYGYTHATFKRYRQSEKADYAGNFIPMVPRHTLAVSTNYSHHFKNRFIDRYQVGLSLTGNGELYWHENNLEKQPFYAMLNAQASVTKGKVTLGIWAKNLTETNYISYLFHTSTNTFGQAGRPFTIGGSCSIAL